MLFLVSTGAEAGLEEGIDAYRSGNYHAALKEFMPLAAKGNAAAQFNLGVMNELGKGVNQNYPKAVFRYRQAAEQGHALAQFKLGVMYLKGEGVPQDYTMAIKWYTKAAEQGDSLAQFGFAVMYANGEGLKVDLAQAYKWFSLAGMVGSPVFEEAMKDRDLLEKNMTPQEIEAGQALVRDWREKQK